MNKGITILLSAAVMTAGMPLSASAAEDIDYEIIGLWYNELGEEYSEFTADGTLYGWTNSNVEEYYAQKNSEEGVSLVYDFTASDGILTRGEADYGYIIEGGTLMISELYGEVSYGYDYTFERVFDYGDVDNDGEINALDASAVLTEYAASATGGALALDFIQTKAADVNCDGAVDALDASEILGYYAYTATGGAGCFAEYYYG